MSTAQPLKPPSTSLAVLLQPADGYRLIPCLPCVQFIASEDLSLPPRRACNSGRCYPCVQNNCECETLTIPLALAAGNLVKALLAMLAAHPSLGDVDFPNLTRETMLSLSQDQIAKMKLNSTSLVHYNIACGLAPITTESATISDGTPSLPGWTAPSYDPVADSLWFFTMMTEDY
ncbi:hypothetical protein EDB81DRAFT_889363 [Dactylonectria macrodidyma]|uniref:Uncharacterized protein n=1 Tax=Dactylonectria macrodidyma TaxID=307937 RepID=A0A9P9DWJ5_9HYPO|nr:hypothetical protein EDB81DRAFT_889363 [Dactylonectria macrodidyma]